MGFEPGTLCKVTSCDWPELPPVSRGKGRGRGEGGRGRQGSMEERKEEYANLALIHSILFEKKRGRGRGKFDL